MRPLAWARCLTWTKTADEMFNPPQGRSADPVAREGSARVSAAAKGNTARLQLKKVGT